MRPIICAVLAGAALLVLPHAPEARAAGKHLTVVSWGGDYTRSQMRAYIKPYRAATGEWVEMATYSGGLAEIREQVETENVTWDVVDFEQSDLLQACQEGLLETIDHGQLPAGSDGTPAEEDFIPGSFTDCGVGQVIWATVVGYDRGQVGGSAPTALADFFNPGKVPGKRGMRRDPRVNLEWALIADGVPPGEVYAALETQAGLKRAFGVLSRIRNQIIWWSSGSEPLQLLEEGAVAMTSVWNGRIHGPIVEDGKDFAILWDGQIWDIDSWGIPRGTDNLAKAVDFVHFATGSRALAEQTRHIPYGPARRSSMAHVDAGMLESLPTSEMAMASALQLNAAWWAKHHARLDAEFEAWIGRGARGPAGTAR